MTSTATKNKKAKKILIIEDEGDMCLLLNIILTEKGITLEHVKSISAAQQFLQKNQLKRKDSVYLMHVNNFKNVQFSAANNKNSTQKNRLTLVSKLDCLIETFSR